MTGTGQSLYARILPRGTAAPTHFAAHECGCCKSVGFAASGRCLGFLAKILGLVSLFLVIYYQVQVQVLREKSHNDLYIDLSLGHIMSDGDPAPHPGHP